MMKKLIFTFFMAAIFAVPALAQKNNVTSAWNYMRYQEWDKAKKAIDEAAENPETKDEAKTWWYRGQVYNGINNSKDEALKASTPNALTIAAESYIKAMELDKNSKRPEQAIADELFSLTLTIFNEAIGAYNQKEFQKALDYFTLYDKAANALGEKKAVLIQTLENNKISPLDIRLYTAGAAQSVGDNESARKIYQELADKKYDEPLVYINLANTYKGQGDTAKALEVLDNGISIVTEKKDVLLAIINTHISRGNLKKAIEYGEKAIELDPENISLYLTMGNMYDEQGMPVKAQEMYGKGLAVNPNHFELNYWAGASRFNQGADSYNKYADAMSMADQDKFMNEAKGYWNTALPYLEKAHEIDANDKSTIKILAEMHAKMGNLEKSQEYRKKLN